MRKIGDRIVFSYENIFFKAFSSAVDKVLILKSLKGDQFSRSKNVCRIVVQWYVLKVSYQMTLLVSC